MSELVDENGNPIERPQAVQLEARRSPTLGDLAARMAHALKLSRNLEEEGFNKNDRYSFVTIGQVVQVSRNALAEAGLAMFIDTVQTRSGDRGKQVTATIKCDVTIVAAESGEYITTTYYGYGIDSYDKQYTKAYTRVLKTAVMKTLLISSATEDEPDALGAPPEVEQQPQQRNQQRKQSSNRKSKQQQPQQQTKPPAAVDWDTANKRFHVLAGDVNVDPGASFKTALKSSWAVESWKDAEAAKFHWINGLLANLEAESKNGEMPPRTEFMLGFAEAAERAKGEPDASAYLKEWITEFCNQG